MKLESKYKINSTLHETNSTVVYQATSLADKRSVILKVLKQDFRNSHKLSQFVNEVKILSELSIPGIVKLLDVIATPQIYVHVLEDIGGDSLYKLLESHSFRLEEALNIAESIMQILAYIHSKDIIHADINPKNIIYNKTTKSVQFIDFGLSLEAKSLINMHEFSYNSGNLSYISPEQTGLTHYEVSSVSDIYSCGMTLYHLFSGKSPFARGTHDELIHKQIAKEPCSLLKIDSKFPTVLAKIISKMIEKKPEERYQTVDAIVYDIEKYRKLSKKTTSTQDFIIAQKDKKILHLSDKLYGREKELHKLKNLAQKVFSGRKSHLLISGESGVGKTTLVQEYIKGFDTSKYHVVFSKFDEYDSYLSSGNFEQVFMKLGQLFMRHNLDKNKDILALHTTEVLAQYFPSLTTIFKLKPEKVMIKKEIAQDISYAIDTFLNVLVTSRTPLIIHIDDLQWIDDASAVLLKKIVVNNANPYLHLILSYRDAEIKENRLALEIVHALEAKKIDLVVHINLKTLNVEHLNAMLEGLLGSDVSDLFSLSQIVHDKTAGNPFYVKSFLEYMLENHILFYKNDIWQFDLKKLKHMNASVNIAQIVINRFHLLDEEEKLYLAYLALLGYKFHLNTALKMMQSIGFTKAKLRKVYNNNFVEIYKDNYIFIHDKIREFIIESLSQEQKRAIHLKIGNYLDKLYKEGVYSDILTITKHLNDAYEEQRTPQKLFDLNFLSLKQLLQSNSYKTALVHARWIVKHYDMQQIWMKSPKKAFLFEFLHAKALYKNALLQEAFTSASQVLKKTRTMSEKLESFSLLKDICVTDGKNFQYLLAEGIDILEQLGLSVPQTQNALQKENEKLNKAIRSSVLYETPQKILKLQEMKNHKKQVISSFLVNFWEVVYYESKVDLMEWCGLYIVYNSFRYGNTAESSFGYVLYGAALIEKEEYNKAYIFAEMALKLVHIFNDEVMLPKIYNFMANFISPYSKPVAKNISFYKKSLQQAKINGDIVFGTWANFLMHFSHFISGNSLDVLQENITLEKQFILESADTKMITIFNVLRESIGELQTGSCDVRVNEKVAIKEWQDEKFYPALAWYALLKAEISFFHQKYDQGLKYLEKYAIVLDNSVIMFPRIQIHFIRSLLLLSKSEKLSKIQENLLAADLEKMFLYSKKSPKTFAFEKLLLEALIAQKTTSTWKVAELYDKALQKAKKMNNHFYISLVGLSAGNFWSTLQYKDITNIYLNEAVVGLKNWGAYKIANQLKKRLEIVKEDKENENVKGQDSSSFTSYKSSKFKNILQSFYKISQSKDSETLIKKLMKIILQTAKASKGILVLKEGNSFFVRASIDFSTSSVSLINKELSTYEDVPKKFLFDAINTQKNMTLLNPIEDDELRYEPYIQKNNPTAIVALSIKIDEELSGVLYLEDKKLDVGIEEESLDVLQLLLTQAAIVFQNTLLIEKISINERNLNQAQVISHTGSWQFNALTLQIIWSAETYRIFDLEPYSVEIDNDLFFSFVHPEDREYVKKAADETLIHTNIYNVRHRIVTAKGVVKYVHQEAELYVENGIKKMFGTIQDITEQMMKDKILIMQSRQAQMGEMISMIAHQWRQPLSVISTIISTQQVYIALDKLKLEALPAMFDEVNEQVKYLSKTIDDFRNFFKPTKERKIISFELLVHNSMHLIKNSLENKGITVELKSLHNPEFNSFENEIQQVILNIFSNAQDAFEGKNIENPQINILIDQDKKYVVLSITDNAGGIDEEVLNTLFLPYISTKFEQNGTGLGLYMSKTIIEEHCNGTIEAKNVVDGAEFTIKIPIKES